MVVFSSLLCLSALTFVPSVHASSSAREVREFATLWKDSVPEISNEPESYDYAAIVDKRTDTKLSDYLIIFKKDLSVARRDLHHRWLNDAISRTHSFVEGIADSDKESDRIKNNIKGYLSTDTVQGYYGSFRSSVVEAIKSSNDVEIVEEDTYDKVSDFVYLQSNAPWGLGRVSHQVYESGTDDAEYLFDSAGGSNTTVYILDSGVKASHRDFTGRVRWGANYVDDMETDVVGHGTHVAGTAAGYSVGVSKFANIVSVKVIDANRQAAISVIVQGLAWIIDDHNSNPGQKSVINYSAVGQISEARTYAINQATAAGIMLVTAAGNTADDACSYGPSNLGNQDGIIAVGALNYTNTPADFSNYGGCVSVYAPGVNTLSCGNDTDSSYILMSGTSMASPHVAGLASYFWSQNSSYSMADIKDMIVKYNQNEIQGLQSNTTNSIAYNHL